MELDQLKKRDRAIANWCCLCKNDTNHILFHYGVAPILWHLLFLLFNVLRWCGPFLFFLFFLFFNILGCGEDLV